MKSAIFLMFHSKGSPTVDCGQKTGFLIKKYCDIEFAIGIKEAFFLRNIAIQHPGLVFNSISLINWYRFGKKFSY